MKKLALFIILIPINIIAENIPVTKVEMETVYQFTYGNKEFQLGKVYEAEGMSTLQILDLYIDDDSYIIQDEGNHRLINISKSFDSFIEIDDLSPIGLINFDSKYLLVADRYGNYTKVYNRNTNEILFNMDDLDINKKIFDFSYLTDFGFFIIDDYLIAEVNKKDSFFIINLDIKDGEHFKIIEEEEAEKFITENNSDIEIIDNKYLLYKGVLKTKSAKKFFDYWENNNPEIYSEVAVFNDEGLPVNAIFSGCDKDGNFYWSSYAATYIFNKNGELINILVVGINDVRGRKVLRFSLDENGNLYRLTNLKNGYALKIIKRFW